jgi:hypothetical protein
VLRACFTTYGRFRVDVAAIGGAMGVES